MKKIIIIFALLLGLVSIASIVPKNAFAACGGRSQVCCTGQGETACDNSGGANLSCIGGHCVPGSACGNAGQACCAGNVCNSGISCVSGSCGTAVIPANQKPATDVLCEGTGINTAIGCLDVLGSQEQFLGDLLRWGIGIGGGIAFLLILYAGFMIMSSSGNPDRLKAGQELLTSAISGLILLIFSVFILKFIGIDILKLDQFGFGGNQETRTTNGPR
jgi:hypothetical protein